MANAAVEKIIIQGESRGLDELGHDLDDVAAAQGRVSQATKDVATVTDRSSKTVSQSSRAYERVAAQVDAAYRAERQYTQGKAALDKAFQQQIIDATVYAQRIDQLSAKYQRLDAANDNAVASLSRVERATQGVHRGMGTAAIAISGTVAALGGLAALQQGVGSFISMSDQASKLEGRLKLVTTSSDQLASVQRDLFQVSQDTRSSFGSNVEL